LLSKHKIPALNVDTLTLQELAKTIDHSLLKPQLTRQQIIDGCELAARYDVASVCVKQSFVPLAVEVLSGTDVAVGTVIGFPHGTSTTRTKAFEAAEMVELGATEIDMVINIGELLSGNLDYVQQDIAAVRQAIGGDVLLKVILENHYLTREQIATACQLAEAAGTDYVKTSTGYAETGATVEDLKLMRATVGPHIGVKAAHGIRSLESALEVIAVGVTRIGATATQKMLDNFKAQKGI
jgi:deoxyribose-phosphate aldolase